MSHPKSPLSRLAFRIIWALVVVSLYLPTSILAQTAPLDPGQDPYTLNPELLEFFEGSSKDMSTNSLFGGDDMKDNGLFTTPSTQLGGASPSLTDAVRDNEEEAQRGPTFILIRSEYSPSGDLTKDSEITLKVTLRNIGENPAEGIVFRAMLQDNYINLLDDPAPDPPFTNNPAQTVPDASNPTPTPPIQDSTVYNPYMTLEWDAIDGQPIDLAPDEEVTFSWSFTPTKDDIVIRWRFVAEFGAGQSVLRQWIPVKNPNPTGVLVPGTPANGIPVSCSTSGASQTQPFPESSSSDQILSAMESRWKFDFRDGSYSWTDPQFKPVLKVWWDTLSAVECTPFLTEVNNKNGGSLAIYAHDIGILWGTYGLDFPGALAINIANHLRAINNGIPEKVTQNIIHETGHAYNNDRGGNPPYWVQHNQIYNSAGPISGYGATSITENFADVVGYYVGRCAGESFQTAGTNPYASGNTEFYNFAKTMIFGNVEFGPPAPASVSC